MFRIRAKFDEKDPEGKIECHVSTGDMDAKQAMAAMTRFRDHITARIEAAGEECPMYRLPIECPFCSSPHYAWAEDGRAECVKCREVYLYDSTLKPVPRETLRKAFPLPAKNS